MLRFGPFRFWQGFFACGPFLDCLITLFSLELCVCECACVCSAHPSARAAVLISAVVLCGRQTENRHKETDRDGQADRERETATGDCLLYYLEIRTLID